MSSIGTGTQSRRNATAVVLAVAILAVVGSIFGFVLGTQSKGRAGESGPGTGRTGPTSAGAGTSTKPAGVKCPTFIADAAHNHKQPAAPGDLTQVVYIFTGKSEAWICRASDGNSLWYQGHAITKKRFADGETVEEGKNGILLPGVNVVPSENAGRNSYNATNVDGNGSTTYKVSADRLIQVQNGREIANQAVVESAFAEGG